jgi:hypothetical protein
MNRREVIALLGGAAAGWPLSALAQQPAMPVVGIVSSRSIEISARNAAAFRKGLNETGYVEGQNVMVEYHWLEGQYDRMPSLMADLVRRQVAVIAAFSPPARRRRQKLRPRRSQSSSSSPKTRSSWVSSPVLPGRAATRPASIFSPLKSWPSGWGSCTIWCPRLFGLPCWLIRPMLRSPRPRYGTYRKLHAPSDCKFSFSTPAPAARSRRPSLPSCTNGLTHSSSPLTGYSPTGVSNLRRSRRAMRF